jgi:Zn-dependent M16 (insulinase) family peptidase
MNISYTPGNIYHGFRLREERFVAETDASCLYFEHERTGARLFKIASSDPNKTFCIGFKTLPASDNGAPHIMEHSVLNGSKNFPVKSPFDVLLKGSLSTFLNAFTSKDYTMYPVASMNDTDYFNLMHVYLDAVFNPLIYEDARIFKQEGWHLEMQQPDAPLNYTGVVYNEMKGAFSNPQRELWYQVFRHLFPQNIYGFESGGTPEAIPSLTYDEFLDFHRTYYHPGNSYILLYGDANLDRELEFIDTQYLARYTRSDREFTITDQPPFDAPREVTRFYPMVEDAGTDNQSFLSYSVVTGRNTDLQCSLALDILCEVLVNQESAPLRIALQEAGIGQDVTASASNFKQNLVQIVAINANPGDMPSFRKIIAETLETVLLTGIDRNEVDGVLNRLEFRLREGDDAQKGLTYLNMMLPRWFFADDPFTGLEYNAILSSFRQSLDNGYLEEMIRTAFLSNPHALYLTLEPKPGLDTEQNKNVESALAGTRAAMSDAEIQTILNETQELMAYQQREDSPEALATVPMLDLADISPIATFYHADETIVSGIHVLTHEQFTNDVVYVTLFFDLTVLPDDMIEYAALLSHITGSLNTRNYTYGTLNQALNLHTGGFHTSLRSFIPGYDENLLQTRLSVSAKAINYKSAKLFELVEEILDHSIYDDPSRIKVLLARHHSQVEAQVKGNGFHVASRRLSSYYSRQGMLNERTGGLSYYWFLCDLMKKMEEDPKTVCENLAQAASLVFTWDNMIAAYTGAKKDFDGFTSGLNGLVRQMRTGNSQKKEWNLTPVKRNEGIRSASNVQYVIQGYNFRKLGYPWNGRMRVLNQVLSTDWLQTTIRVIGGAYGGFASISPYGNFTFNSYRDPNLESTFENYEKCVGYLASFTADRQMMSRYIIGTIAETDAPLTPSQRGEQAINNYFTGRTAREVQLDRDEILSTTDADIRNFSGMVSDILSQHHHCVYGNAEKLEQAAGHFDSLIKPER